VIQMAKILDDCSSLLRCIVEVILLWPVSLQLTDLWGPKKRISKPHLRIVSDRHVKLSVPYRNQKEAEEALISNNITKLVNLFKDGLPLNSGTNVQSK
jgi:hypothetical protein